MKVRSREINIFSMSYLAIELMDELAAASELVFSAGVLFCVDVWLLLDTLIFSSDPPLSQAVKHKTVNAASKFRKYFIG